MEKQIQINGIEYIRKDSINESIDSKRFNFKTTKLLITAISKKFRLAGIPKSEDYFIKNDKALVDSANVGLIYGKTEEAKRLLSYFVDKNIDEYCIKELPKLEYKIVGSSKFSLEYIKPFIDILNITDNSLKIQVADDYPLTIENKDFMLILAPRVEND